MSIVIKCESCKAPLKLPEEYIGQEVRCPSCQQVFVARASHEVPPPRPTSVPREEPPRPEEEEERPSRRRGYDDDRPRRRPDDDDDDEDRPRRRRGYYDDAYGRGREPHRGSSIHTMGILSVVFAFCCWPVGLVLGIVALVMANGDLAKMQSGYMDRSGESQTTTGRTCAIIGLVLIPIVVLASCLFNAAIHAR